MAPQGPRSRLLAVVVMCVLVPLAVLQVHGAVNQVKQVQPSPIPNRNDAHMVNVPSNFNELRAKAYAAGRTKIAPQADTPLMPASNCHHCLPGDECYPMCDNLSTDAWMPCPRCNACYNPDVHGDVAVCTENGCADNDGFDHCLFGLVRDSRVLDCRKKYIPPNLRLKCYGVTVGIAAAKFLPCYFSHCVPW